MTRFLAYVELRIQRGEDQLLRELQPAGGEMHEGREDPALAEAGANGATGRAAAPPGYGGPAAVGSARMVTSGGSADAGAPAVDPRTPRNATCPCGSGKKYKHCHGRV